MRRQPAKALLIDFDGVLRRWDPAVAAGVETTYGLAPGALLGAAMSWDLLRPAIAGELTHEQWMGIVAQRLPIDADTATAAVAQWQAYRGEVDPDVLALIREVRAAGLPVGLATNATDLLDADLAALGLVGEVDAVINSSVLGIHKPAPEYFARAVEAVRSTPPWTLFVDDEDRVVRAARASKLLAYRWTGAHELDYLRAALGLA
jgi:putative hydrolase of the HAD superfamily